MEKLLAAPVAERNTSYWAAPSTLVQEMAGLPEEVSVFSVIEGELSAAAGAPHWIYWAGQNLPVAVPLMARTT